MSTEPLHAIAAYMLTWVALLCWINLGVLLHRQRRAAPPAAPGETEVVQLRSDNGSCLSTDKARAEALLERWLSPGQLRLWRAHRCFSVSGSEGGFYLIFGDFDGVNVCKLHAGLPRDYLCFTVCGVPAGDRLLAQKLALETDEPGVLRIAGRFP